MPPYMGRVEPGRTAVLPRAQVRLDANVFRARPTLLDPCPAPAAQARPTTTTRTPVSVGVRPSVSRGRGGRRCRHHPRKSFANLVAAARGFLIARPCGPRVPRRRLIRQTFFTADREDGRLRLRRWKRCTCSRGRRDGEAITRPLRPERERSSSTARQRSACTPQARLPAHLPKPDESRSHPTLGQGERLLLATTTGSRITTTEA